MDGLETRWIWDRPGWPALRWDGARLAAPLAAARRAQERLAGVVSILDAGSEIAAQAEILGDEGLSTAAIEGDRLDPLAVRSSIARRLGLSTAGLPAPTRAIDGLVEMISDAAERASEPLTLERLCGWQAALFPTGRSGTQRIRAGELRGEQPMRIVSGPEGRERVHFEAPPRDRLDDELERLLAWVERPPENVDGIVRAGLAHAWFEVLHPFEDGNGRVGRAILDLLLVRDAGRTARVSSVSARFLANRSAYYAELERLSSGDLDVTPWLVWFVGQVTEAAESSRAVVGLVVRRARFWMAHGRAVTSERQRKVLSRMLEVGPGQFEGGMTTRKYVHLAGVSPATAQRDLATLAAIGCLVARGSGRSVRYELVEP